MNPNMCITESEYAKADPSSPIEAALERLASEQERAEKAFRVLADRIDSVLQPEEPTDALAVMDGEKAGSPQSPVVRRIHAAADDLARLSSRMHRLADRSDA